MSEGFWLVVVEGLIAAVLFGILMAALVKQNTTHRTATVIALSGLTSLCLAGYALTRSEAFITLAGAGLGAIAGAVTGGGNHRRDSSDE